MSLIKKNIWSILGLIITVISIILAFYFAKEKKREPVYFVKNKPSLIFDKSNSIPKIKLLVDDSLLITQNVYITTLEVWNKGDLPITKEDIRKDFIIYCSDSLTKILDYKILEEKEKGVSKFKLLPLDRGLKIDWDYFDPGFGFLFQIIYSGTKSSEVKISGYVLDTEVKPFQKSAGIGKMDRILFYVLIACLPCYIGLTWFYYKYRKRFKNMRLQRIFKNMKNYQFLMLMTVIIIVFIVIWFLLFKDDILKINPPF
jgi:hypothetical protein